MDQVLARWAEGLATAIWAFIAAALLKYLGIEFDPDQALTLSSALAAFLTAVFVGGIHWIAKRFPKLGWLTLTPNRVLFLTVRDRNAMLGALKSGERFASLAPGSQTKRLENLLR